MSNQRSELQNEVARALVESKAIDFEAVGRILSKFGARAALNGDSIGAIIGRKCMDICIPPEPYVIGLSEIAGKINQER
ncbi:MAG: hypothetical protein ABW032_01535 [Burkholderiaceae bacterium]